MSNLTSAVSRLPVDPSDRSDVIDLVNRLNMAFDEWTWEPWSQRLRRMRLFTTLVA